MFVITTELDIKELKVETMDLRAVYLSWFDVTKIKSSSQVKLCDSAGLMTSVMAWWELSNINLETKDSEFDLLWD
uniref:Uncharacterized protein n=1 Tax=Strigamia maritima TaxID=126957 RepID=T1JNK1_STRMM